jgi:LysR family hydrogen peroxide-inducible transcriptional activator
MHVDAAAHQLGQQIGTDGVDDAEAQRAGQRVLAAAGDVVDGAGLLDHGLGLAHHRSLSVARAGAPLHRHAPADAADAEENFTVKLLEMLRTGEIDCAILAEPFPDTGLAVAKLYDEPFVIAMPAQHPLAKRESISAEELKRETMLLLGNGHCFRDQVLEVCPEFARFSADADGLRRSFEGSSLETIKHMVAAGLGITVLPQLTVPRDGQGGSASHLRFVPFSDPIPTRRVVLVWRRSFTRYEAIAALRNAVYACKLEGVTRLS